MATLSASGIAYTVFFYNPNIHPAAEYLRRKDENKRYADTLRVPFVDADYEIDAWFARTKGLEDEPERGRRCTLCFDMRLGRAARHAHDHGFPVLTSSLGLSRWKNWTQVNACGHRAVAPYNGLVYWDHNWRKGGGAEIGRLLGFEAGCAQAPGQVVTAQDSHMRCDPNRDQHGNQGAQQDAPVLHTDRFGKAQLALDMQIGSLGEISPATQARMDLGVGS